MKNSYILVSSTEYAVSSCEMTDQLSRNLHNVAQKGKITVSKSGEVFSRVSGNKGLYQPIFAVESLEGAVYEIAANLPIIDEQIEMIAEAEDEKSSAFVYRFNQ